MLASALKKLYVAGEKLARERQRYQELFEFAPDSYLATGITGTIQEANRAATSLLRAGREALLGQPMTRFVAPDEHRRFEAYLVQLRRVMERRRGGWEVMMHPLEGAPFPASLTASSVRGPVGQVTGLYWLIRDISRQKRDEAKREQLLRELQKARISLTTLRHLLPICAACKRIRDDDGYWTEVAAYISAHSETKFTHSLCPACRDMLYPDLSEREAAFHDTEVDLQLSLQLDPRKAEPASSPSS